MKAPPNHRPIVCQAEDCTNPLAQKRRGGIRLYCTQACQKRQKRKEKKRLLQGYTMTDITPRPVEQDMDLLIKRALKDLEKKLDKNGVKQLTERLDKIIAFQQEQKTQSTEVKEVEIRTERQRQLAKAFGDFLAQRTDA